MWVFFIITITLRASLYLSMAGICSLIVNIMKCGENKTNSMLHNGLLDLMNRSTCFGHYYAHHQELATIQMVSAYGSSPWLRQVAGLVHGCRFLERPVRGMFESWNIPLTVGFILSMSSTMRGQTLIKLLGAFASEKRLTTSSFLYVCSKVSKRLPYGDFHENLYLGFLPKSVGIFRLRLTSAKTETLYMKTYAPLWSSAMIGLHNWDCVPCEVHHRLMNQFLDRFEKLRKATVSFAMSVRPHRTTWLQLDGFSWNLIFEDFMKICRENSSFIKIGQEQKGSIHEDPYTFFTISRSFLLRMRNVSDKSCREHQQTFCVQ